MGNLTLSILTFPLWWYTTGTQLVWNWVVRQLTFGLHQTGLLVFAKHIREPLYGDYTRSGIVFSFFLRLLLLGFKLVMFSLRSLGILLLMAGYLLLLPACLVMIIYQLFPAA